MIAVEWYRENSRYIKIEIGVRDCIVEHIMFSGDFFEEPEGLIERIEDEIKGLRLREALDILGSLEQFGRIIGVDWREVFEKLCFSLVERYGECIKNDN